MKLVFVLVPLASLGIGLLWRPRSLRHRANPVPYPEAYRTWAHVKSTAIGPTHKNFTNTGGFPAFLRERRGLEGYRTRLFPDGASLVVSWLAMRDNSGAFAEGRADSWT